MLTPNDRARLSHILGSPALYMIAVDTSSSSDAANHQFSHKVRENHILDAIDKISAALTDYTLTLFASDWEKRLVIERLLEIIGEAANHLSLELQASYPDIPWSQMIGMRNVVSHQYFRIDVETVWKTATDAVPPLRSAIEQILTQNSEC